jgi:hypothetical protein
MVKSNVSCFEAHEKEEVPCKDTNCKNWINCKSGLNCVLIAAKGGPKTLQEIGEIFDLTRMRICQIEKSVLGKLKTSLPD